MDVVSCSAAQFDAAKHLNTHPDLLGHSHNRLTLDKLKTVAISSSADDEALSVCIIVNCSASSIVLLSCYIVANFCFCLTV